MQKKGFELAISTIILLIIGLLVLIALILAFTGVFANFWSKIRGYSGSEVDNLAKLCDTQCRLDNKYSFCCEEKKLGKQNTTCLDERIKIECEINCGDIC